VGLATWVIAEAFFAEATVPPQLVGLFASILGMIGGSLAPQIVRDGRAGTHARA
jgi:hypothetical protein